MGWSESERGLCKFHPEVKQFPGAFCSTCLAEKLTQLYSPCSSFPESKLTADFLGYGFLPIQSCSSSSSEYSSATSSPHHKRNASEIMGRSMSSTFMFSKAHGMKKRELLMKKSRSLAVVSSKKSDHREFADDDVAASKSGKKKKKKRGGFWSKLIKGMGRKTKQVFKHPKTDALMIIEP